VFLVHPDQSEQVPAMLDRYRSMIEGTGGKIHRQEDWGRRQLAHSIAKVHKAHYLLLNIECEQPALDELVGAFRFSDAVLRHLVIKRDRAFTEPSFMAQAHEEEKAREAQGSVRDRPRERRPDDESLVEVPGIEIPGVEIPGVEIDADEIEEVDEEVGKE
jgi:small subunit ribosomal protein S6